MQKARTLREVWTGSPNRHCFGYMDTETEYPIPWEDIETAPSLNDLDEMLFSEYGERLISPLLQKYVDEETGKIPDSQHAGIAHYVHHILQSTWYRYLADFTAEYNPSENYAMTETGLDTERNSGTDSLTQSYTGYKETDKFGHAVKSAGSSGLYGFDSGSAVNADTNENVTAYVQTDKDGNVLTGDTHEVEGTKTDSTTHGHVKTIEHSFTRAGNIGVKQAAEMLRTDLSLWQDMNMWKMVVRDVAELLTIPMYE